MPVLLMKLRSVNHLLEREKQIRNEANSAVWLNHDVRSKLSQNFTASSNQLKHQIFLKVLKTYKYVGSHNYVITVKHKLLTMTAKQARVENKSE